MAQKFQRANLMPPGAAEVPVPQDYPADNSLTLLFESIAAADAFRHWLLDEGGWAAFGAYVDSLP